MAISGPVSRRRCRAIRASASGLEAAGSRHWTSLTHYPHDLDMLLHRQPEPLIKTQAAFFRPAMETRRGLVAQGREVIPVHHVQQMLVGTALRPHGDRYMPSLTLLTPGSCRPPTPLAKAIPARGGRIRLSKAAAEPGGNPDRYRVSYQLPPQADSPVGQCW